MIIEMGGREYLCRYVTDPSVITRELEQDQPHWITYDTETDGLHIKKKRAFLGIIAWKGKSFVWPATEEFFLQMPVWASMTGRVYAHFTSFDMHAMANTVGDAPVLQIKNWGDTMGICRLTFEAISSREGGPSLALKEVSTKYIDSQANRFQKEINAWLKAKEAQDRKVLIAVLRSVGWSVKRFQSALDGAEPVPSEIMEIYNAWCMDYPKPSYKDVPMEIMMPYAATDGILTDILVEMGLPVVEYRQQTHIMEREFELIPVVFRTERRGIEVDRDYLLDAKEKMELYIQDLTVRMHLLAGREFSVGQHKVIKEIYTERTGETPDSTDKQYLNKQARSGDDLATTISKLRRLEKWLATYIDKILEDSAYDGRFYTSLGQFNPVSGRFSGDAQQFPKDKIYDDDGNEIYNPRRAFKMRGYYLDFSQVELRVQAHYTMPFGGDLNLWRAYMPFKCAHSVTGEIYRFDTPEERARWIELREGAPTGKHWEDQLKEGWSVWVVPETGNPWIPTDVHSQTTQKALDIIGDMQGHDFKWWRNIGKRFNFMRNYGGGDKKAAETLEIPLEHAKAMNKGYTDAFPLVVSYQGAVIRQFERNGYVKNLSGRRYYLSDPWRFYKGANYLIQGSCADDLKDKLVRIQKWLDKNNCKSQMVLYVHDEIQFEVPEEEDWIVPHIKTIMEDCPDILVPIVAEVEFTSTYWSEKKKVLL